MKYTGKQNRELRARGHNLKPIVFIGIEGITQQILSVIEQELVQQELIKVKIGKGKDLIGRKQAAVILSEKTGAHVAQIIGKVILLYRPNTAS